MRRRWVLPLLVLSGFSGIAYELLWVRLLTLSLGATTASFSIVLAVFFGGLALGSRWAGRRSTTATRPLAAYAWLELLTGVLGLGIYPVLTHLGAVVAAVDPGTSGAGVGLRVVLSAVVLLPPTFLMGATLPFVSVGTIERDDATGSGTALVYGLNTLGACLGAFALTFLLLPRLGIFGSTLVTVAINFVVGGVALAASRANDGPAAPPSPAAAAESLDSRRRFAVVLAAALGGFVATGAQVVWARLFAIALRGTAYGIGSVLVAVLTGIAAGSLLASFLERRTKHAAALSVGFQLTFLAGLTLFAVSVPFIVYSLGTLVSAGLTGTSLHLVELAVVLVSLALPTVAAGAILPSLVNVAEQSARNSGKTLSVLYSANTLGCIVGSLLTGFVLLPGAGSAATLYLMAFVLALTTVVFAVATCADRRTVVGAALAVVVVTIALFPQLDPRTINPRGIGSDFFTYLKSSDRYRAGVVSYYEGDVATVAVTDAADVRGLTLNGLGQGSRSRVPPWIAHESVLVGTTPWLHARQAERALVVGLGAGGTIDVLAKLGVGKIEVAELERGVIDAVGEIWEDASPLKNERVSVINNDARHHLLTSRRRAPHSYDFITSMPAHPWVASALFTKEFFELAKDNLREGGVFSTWFGPAAMPDEAIEGLFGAFTAVFPHTLTYWVPEAGAFYLVGSEQPLSFDVEKANQLIDHPATAGLARTQTEWLFMAARVTGATTPSLQAKTTRVSTDDNGLIEFGAQRPRTKGLLGTLTYLPVRALPPSMYTGTTDRSANALEALEVAMGSRGAWLPFSSSDATAVGRAISALEDSDPSLKAYGAFRLRMAEGKRAEAAALLPSLTTPVHLERAKAILAWTEADRAAKVAALEGLVSRPDARAALIALGKAPADVELPPPSIDGDPIGWLFASPAALSALDRADRARTTRWLVERLAAFESRALAERARALFTAAGWDESARWAATLELDMDRAASNTLVRRALEAGSKERYPEAAKLLVEASKLTPLRDEQVKTLLQTALRVGDAELITAAKDMLAMRGNEPVTIEAMAAQLREANAKEKAKPPTPPKPTDPP